MTTRDTVSELTDERLRPLIEQIDALLDIDARGQLVPHGIGGLARELLSRSREVILSHRSATGEAVAVPGAHEAFAALDVADRLIERAYGSDTPKEWNKAYRAVAKARSASPSSTPTQKQEPVAVEVADLVRRLEVAADGIDQVDLDRRSMRRGYENLLREARSALIASPAQVVSEEWQPIDTAPKDGQYIDLWVSDPDRSTGYRVTNARWHIDNWETGHGVGVEFFFDLSTGIPRIRATHWRAVPAAPALSHDKGGMNAELLNCPFCGDTHPFVEGGSANRHVTCNNPECQASLVPSASDAEAIAAWNRRTPSRNSVIEECAKVAFDPNGKWRGRAEWLAGYLTGREDAASAIRSLKSEGA